ncbi:MAG TPA: hypothetical protein QGF58_09740 [Myxococcota bacterium]|nr:hypothetical protein [Myxococcota bacterium]
MNATSSSAWDSSTKGSGAPGWRGAVCTIREGCWSNVLEFKLRNNTAFLQIAEEGLDILADAEPNRRVRLEEVHDLYSFFDEELPALMARWRARKEKA